MFSGRGWRSKGLSPRVCGGAGVAVRYGDEARGLSPRVRGSLGHIQHPPAHDGSIPACAGEPCPPRSWTPIRRVYPRVCGGAGCGTLGANEVLGLSPRVRGSLFATSRVPTPYGSIPACAGEPGIRGGGRATDGVYPRVCGGAPDVVACGPGKRGSIPACAGEPTIRRTSRSPNWVYPRVCGGAASIGTESSGTLGLSPRVRGSPDFACMHDVSPGSIPACAGEPAP